MPNKPKEAPKYKPFTEEEKAKILARHQELVARMNRSLPPDMQLSVDLDLARKLDDPKVYGIYRIAQEMEEKRNAQKAIQESLASKFGRSQQRPDPLSRTIFYEFDTSGTPAATAYNEKMYQDYLHDPQKIIAMRYGALMESDPTGIYECDDDPLKLAEYYKDTYPDCERGFVFQSVVTAGDPTPEMKKALNSMVKPMETIGYPVNMMRAAKSLDYFACPSLSLTQSVIIQNADKDLHAKDETMKRILDEALVKDAIATPKQFFGKFVERGIKLEKGMFVKYRPESYDLDAEGNPINIEETKYDNVFSDAPKGNFRISQRDGNNLQQVQMMNASVQREYLKGWQKSFNQASGTIGEFNIAEIEDRHKGGFIERYIRRNTSREYKEFLQAFKEYNDPKSKNYLNRDNLLTKGNGYLQHKVDQGYRSMDDMKGTSLGRTKFVIATITACQNAPLIQDVKDEWAKEYEPPIKREAALSAKDVEDKPLESEQPANEKDLEKEAEIQAEEPTQTL